MSTENLDSRISNPKIPIFIIWGHQNTAVHIGMAPGFEHQGGSQMVVMCFAVPSIFQNRVPFELRKTIDNNTKRFSSGMHIDCLDLQPIAIWFKVRIL